MQDYSQFASRWQFRFGFYDQHGAPSTPTYKAAFKAATFGQRFKLSGNIPAFLFSWIYFLCKGMWRKGLSWLGIWVLLILIAAMLPQALGRGLGIGFSALCSISANYAYYLHRIKGSTSWNPFEGLRWW